MKLQYIGLLGIGLIAALCAAVLFAWTKATPTKPVAEDVSVVVASKDVPAMTTLTADMCEVKKIARKLAPEVSVPDATAIIGQVVIIPVVKGQVYTQACFAPQGSGYHLASTLPEGKRAVSVALADYSVLEGLLYPGSTVDVIASFDMRSKGDNHTGVISKTLLHSIQVLAVENRTVVSQPGAEEAANGRAGNENRRRVTLLVDPDQAEMLQLAMVHGVISLAMRKPNDKAQSSDHITRLIDLGLPAELLEEEHAQVITKAPDPVVVPATAAAVSAPPPPPAPVTKVEERGNPMWNVTVLRGGNTSTQSFPVPESARAEHRK